MTLDRSLALLIVVVVGGLGHAYGPLLGAVFIVCVSQAMADLYEWANYLFGALLLTVMVFMPEGLSGLLRPRRGRPIPQAPDDVDARPQLDFVACALPADGVELIGIWFARLCRSAS